MMRTDGCGWMRGWGSICAALPMMSGYVSSGLVTVACLAFACVVWTAGPAWSDGLRTGLRFHQAGDFPRPAAVLLPLAEAGQPRAQTVVGSLYETGRGVPQNMTIACYWYRRAAEQGEANAQYLLGLQYDKGIGVPRDPVEAQKWLILSAAAGVRSTQQMRARIRDALLTKMTRGEIAA